MKARIARMPKVPKLAARLPLLGLLGIPLVLYGYGVLAFVLKLGLEASLPVCLMLAFAWGLLFCVAGLVVKLRNRKARIVAQGCFNCALLLSATIAAWALDLLLKGPSGKSLLFLVTLGGLVYAGFAVEGMLAMRRWALYADKGVQAEAQTETGRPWELYWGMFLSLIASMGGLVCGWKVFKSGLAPEVMSNLVQIQGAVVAGTALAGGCAGILAFRGSEKARRTLLVLVPVTIGAFLLFPVMTRLSGLAAAVQVLVGTLALSFFTGERSVGYCRGNKTVRTPGREKDTP